MEIIESAENEKKGYVSKLSTKFPNENKLWENPFVATPQWYNPNNWTKKEPPPIPEPQPPPEPPRPEPPAPEPPVIEKLSEPPPKPNTVPHRNGVIVYIIIIVLTVLLCYILT